MIMGHGERAVFSPIEEQRSEAETFPDDNPGGNAAGRVLSAMGATAACSDGKSVEGRVLDTCTAGQTRVISHGMFTKLQANYLSNILINQGTCSVVLADQAAEHAVGSAEFLNVTVTSGVAGLIQLSNIVSTVLEGDDDLLLLGHPTMVAKLGNSAQSMLTMSTNLPATIAEDKSAAPSRP